MLNRFIQKPSLKSILSRSYSKKTVPKTKLFINGKFYDSQATEWFEVRNPVRNSSSTKKGNPRISDSSPSINTRRVKGSISCCTRSLSNVEKDFCDDKTRKNA
jgi:hypothetical protein